MSANDQTIRTAIARTYSSIDLNETGQRGLFEELKKYYSDLPFDDKQKADRRFFFENDWFSYGDATILYCMIRHLRPKRIIEIGSGYSSAVMLDTNDLAFDGKIACTFIEPRPERLLSLLHDRDRQSHEVITKPVEEVGLDRFYALSPGDILFVDSSHISASGTDVNHIFFEILPALHVGVMVHFHDIFVGFEYPREWLLQKRPWNEIYLLRAFLQYNRAFQVKFFNNFFGHFYRECLERDMPLCMKNIGGSMWLEKIANNS